MLLILGLDGATLDLVEAWASCGELPHLARLMREGSCGRLASTVPAATFPSWTTFMTGVNPGRHGVFDFTRRDPGSYRVRFVNATFRKAPSIWRRLSDAGKRVTVLGLPGTYPPESINGYMVSGFDTPVTTRADASFVHPPRFARELERLGGFPFADFQEFRIDSGWHERALASLLEAIQRKERLARELLDREPWDCFMLLLGESDTAAHHFWRFHDPASPRFDAAGSARLGDPIRTVYRALDGLVGRLVERVPGARVLIVSDHGFGGAGDTALRLNRWLAENGWLAWQPSGRQSRRAGALRSAALAAIPERWQAACFRLAGGRIASAVESGVRFGGIDWRRTQAFSEELNYAPSVWLNVAGRDPGGQVAAADYDRTCARLAEQLRAWQDPIHGTKVVRHVWRRDEVYDGACVEWAPDLILDLETPGRYSYVCLPSYGQSGPVLERMSGAALSAGKLSGMSGSHRPDGLFILTGPEVAPGRLRGAAMADMAPTILALCGVGVPSGWDGRPLPCLTRAAAAAAAVEEPMSAESVYDEEQEERLRRRLEDLGYLA
jgi:predicted AlkP superfamily phosphohydrolase/phosphomutase